MNFHELPQVHFNLWSICVMFEELALTELDFQ